MTAIRVTCRSCGREVNSAEVDRAMHCTVCVGRQAIGPSLKRYQELWAKRTRYRRQGHPHAALERQIGGLVQRMSQKLHERIAQPQAAAEVLNKMLQEARQRADSSAGILVARPGQDVLGLGAKA